MTAPDLTPDAQALADVHAQAFSLPAPWSTQDFAGFLQDRTCFLEWTGTPDGKIAGFALFRLVADEAEVLTLAVLPKMQRRGIASALLRKGMRQLQARRAQTCFLEVASTNHAARSLYDRAGFVQTGLRKGYYTPATGGNALDALVLRIDLGGA
ncbi:ribosomal protein S18-alanine N-acetyltransferase [Roseinatronobacter sp. NSM]|uniref:ribosomal protein S18-alanine N-acetyltransferase n=1 Tax=Roseinatronobacter sp. NSM TaxID=3457785 RepID=UPI004036D28E